MRRRAHAIAASIALLCALAMARAVAQPRADDEVGLLVQEARVALERGHYRDAGALLDRALAADPRQIHVYVLRASVYGVAGEYDRAVAILRKARALAPDNLDVLTALGVHLVFARDYAEGVPLLERVVAQAAQRYDAQSVLGAHYVRTRQWQRAIVALEAYLIARPKILAREDARHRAQLAEARLRSGEPARAISLYREVLATDPDSVLARLGLLWATAAIDCKRATAIAARMRELAARYPAVLLVQAQCALALGDHTRAAALAVQYRSRAPNDAHAWGLIGRLAAARYQPAQARQAFERAVALAPGEPRWSIELARAERRAGDPTAAVRRLRARRPTAELERAWTIELAWSLLELKRPAEARELLMPIIASYRDDATARTVLGVALVEIGQLDGAIEHLERAETLGGEHRMWARSHLAEARAARGRGHLAAGRLVEAEADLGRAYELGSVRGLGAYAALLIDRGAFERAGEVLGTISPLVPRDRILLAKVHLGQGRMAEAERVLERILAADPAGVVSHQVRLELASLRLRDGRAEAAMNALGPALAAAPSTALEHRLTDAFATAAMAAATDAMAAGGLRRAHRILTELDARLPAGHVRRPDVACHLALAATGAGDTALPILRRLTASGATCPFAPPADKLAVPILEAWNDGLTRRRARAALARLDKLRRKATGPAAVLWQTAVRDVALRAAAAAHEAGDLGEARQLVTTARAVAPRGVAEVEHAGAAMLLETGKLDNAIAILERVAGEVPEAHINLGIAWERKGDPLRALRHFEAALAAGVKHPALRAWVDTKRRVWGAP